MARILIAGCDSTRMEILASEIEAEGHEVIEAATGQDAYERALSEQPDMVFLEVNLPVFNGYETCDMIRQDPDIPERLPVIFLTTPDVDLRKIETVRATATLPALHEAYETREILSKHVV